MTITLNTINQTAGKLLKQTTIFNSPHIDTLKMVNNKYYSKTPLNPEIETHKIMSPKGIHSEFSSKTFTNGSKFEVYRLSDEIIKVAKNRFGEIKAFKSNIKQHNLDPMRIYENVKKAMHSQIHNFLI